MWWGRLVLVGATAGLAGPAVAQAAPEQPRETVVVRGASFCNSRSDAAGARSLSLDCLNAELKADAGSVDPHAPVVSAKDAAGTGAPNQVGVFSFTATSVRMGNGFGHAVTPQRPPQPSFTNALLPGGK